MALYDINDNSAGNDVVAQDPIEDGLAIAYRTCGINGLAANGVVFLDGLYAPLEAIDIPARGIGGVGFKNGPTSYFKPIEIRW